MDYIVTFDVETTGLSPKVDHIIQLAAIKLRKSDNAVVGTFSHYIKPVDPNYVINPRAAITNGLSKEFIDKNGVSLQSVANEFLEFIKDADYLTYNGNNFDIPFLARDFAEIGIEFPIDGHICYDSYIIEKYLHPSNLGAVFENYIGNTMEEKGLKAHDALSDVKATAMVFIKQMEASKMSYDDISRIKGIDICSTDNSLRRVDGDAIVFNTGKYVDSDIYEVAKKDPSYFRWAMDNMFHKSTKKLIAEYIQKCRSTQA